MPCGDNGEAEFYEALDRQSENFKVLYDHHKNVEAELEQLRLFATWALERINDLQLGTANADIFRSPPFPDRTKSLDIPSMILRKDKYIEMPLPEFNVFQAYIDRAKKLNLLK